MKPRLERIRGEVSVLVAQATTRRISSIDVRPMTTFVQPSSRSAIMPCLRAMLAISAAEITQVARKQGMIALRDDGWAKVVMGLTSIEEILRVVA